MKLISQILLVLFMTSKPGVLHTSHFYYISEKHDCGESGPIWIGCFLDPLTSDPLVKAEKKSENDTWDIKTCNKACNDYNMPFFALRGEGNPTTPGYHCLCGNDFATAGEVWKVVDEQCGGKNGAGASLWNSIFHTCRHKGKIKY